MLTSFLQFEMLDSCGFSYLFGTGEPFSSNSFSMHQPQATSLFSLVDYNKGNKQYTVAVGVIYFSSQTPSTRSKISFENRDFSDLHEQMCLQLPFSNPICPSTRICEFKTIWKHQHPPTVHACACALSGIAGLRKNRRWRQPFMGSFFLAPKNQDLTSEVIVFENVWFHTFPRIW